MADAAVASLSVGHFFLTDPTQLPVPVPAMVRVFPS